MTDELLVGIDRGLDIVTGAQRVVAAPERGERFDEPAHEGTLNYAYAVEAEMQRWAHQPAPRRYWHGTTTLDTDPLPDIPWKRLLHDIVGEYEPGIRQGSRGTKGKPDTTVPTPEGMLGRSQKVTNASLDERAKKDREYERGA